MPTITDDEMWGPPDPGDLIEAGIEDAELDACDACGGAHYPADDPFVEVRPPRPSDPSDLACVLVGHRKCFPGSRTPAEWNAYIESPEAREAGHLFLT